MIGKIGLALLCLLEQMSNLKIFLLILAYSKKLHFTPWCFAVLQVVHLSLTFIYKKSLIYIYIYIYKALIKPFFVEEAADIVIVPNWQSNIVI